MIEFTLDLKSSVPFYRQIQDQIRFSIASKKLMPGEQLPTVRELAVRLEINPNTVRKAYSELEILRILDTQQGTGTFVGQKALQIEPEEKARMIKQICDELISRAQQYDFSVEDVLDHLLQRMKEESR